MKGILLLFSYMASLSGPDDPSLTTVEKVWYVTDINDAPEAVLVGGQMVLMDSWEEWDKLAPGMELRVSKAKSRTWRERGVKTFSRGERW
jgi:hypothetical protein